MLDTVDKLPDDPSILKEMIVSLASELTDRDAELKSRDVLIEKLKRQLAGLRRHQFGSRSESLDQLELTLEEEEIARAADVPQMGARLRSVLNGPASADTSRPRGYATLQRSQVKHGCFAGRR